MAKNRTAAKERKRKRKRRSSAISTSPVQAQSPSHDRVELYSAPLSQMGSLTA
jgi:hypothetical protein